MELCPKGSTAQPERGVAPKAHTEVKGCEYQGTGPWPLGAWEDGSSCLTHQIGYMSLEQNNSFPRPRTSQHLANNIQALLWEQSLAPVPALTQVSLQPLVSLDELVDQGKVMGVGLIWHHPSTCCDLQLPISHQPEDEGTHGVGQGPFAWAWWPENGGDCIHWPSGHLFDVADNRESAHSPAFLCSLPGLVLVAYLRTPFCAQRPRSHFSLMLRAF